MRHSLLPSMLLMAVSILWVTGLTLRPKDGEPVAALFPPGTSRDQALAAAASVEDSEIVAFGNLPSIVLVHSAGTDLPARLRAAGAWLVVRAPLAAGCLR